VGVQLFVGLVWSNGYGSCFGGSVGIGGFSVIKCLWELCRSECSNCCGRCDQRFKGTVLVGV